MSKRSVIATTEFSAMRKACRMIQSKAIARDFNHISTMFHAEHNESLDDFADHDTSTMFRVERFPSHPEISLNAHPPPLQVAAAFPAHSHFQAQCSTWNVLRFRGLPL
jgi:hypothetical protein